MSKSANYSGSIPLFTQKHYEAVMGYIRMAHDADKKTLAFSMCEMFAMDNPNFNRQRFLACLGEDNENTRTHVSSDD